MCPGGYRSEQMVKEATQFAAESNTAEIRFQESMSTLALIIELVKCIGRQ
jgi:hypothetical protein